MKHGNHGSCILPNLLKHFTIMHFSFNIMHKSMSNFAYKYKIKKIYINVVKYVLGFIPSLHH